MNQPIRNLMERVRVCRAVELEKHYPGKLGRHESRSRWDDDGCNTYFCIREAMPTVRSAGMTSSGSIEEWSL